MLMTCGALILIDFRPTTSFGEGNFDCMSRSSHRIAVSSWCSTHHLSLLLAYVSVRFGDALLHMQPIVLLKMTTQYACDN